MTTWLGEDGRLASTATALSLSATATRKRLTRIETLLERFLLRSPNARHDLWLAQRALTLADGGAPPPTGSSWTGAACSETTRTRIHLGKEPDGHGQAPADTARVATSGRSAVEVASGAVCATGWLTETDDSAHRWQRRGQMRMAARCGAAWWAHTASTAASSNAGPAPRSCLAIRTETTGETLSRI
ncbi:helix-turn-helix domain-containing protein [Streptomyces silvisoli]|uniref:helix-turn-helix domain-containing protein n=1 Tax=Streptomyces silvisoli TaxID=3034235 RepID=UPI003703A114